METIETYKCTECEREIDQKFASWNAPECPFCGDNLSVIETTDNSIKL